MMIWMSIGTNKESLSVEDLAEVENLAEKLGYTGIELSFLKLLISESLGLPEFFTTEDLRRMGYMDQELERRCAIDRLHDILIQSD
jgi:hypothetical protein